MDHFQSVPDEIKIGLLMVNISRLHATRADQHMERIGLYRGQAILLMILSDHNGLSHSEIAEKLVVSPASATKVIKRMEALHYVQRRPDPADERVSRVFLEAGGWAKIEQIRQTFEQIDAVLVSKLSKEEQGQLIQLLLKVYDGLVEGTSAGGTAIIPHWDPASEANDPESTGE